MLRGIEAPTDFESEDRVPSMSKEQKLTLIRNTPIEVSRAELVGYYLNLPLIDGVFFDIIDTDNDGLKDTAYIEHINVGDKDLYGESIGTRLLQATTAFALDMEPGVNTLEMHGARLGALNAIIKVLGEGRVTLGKYGNFYGMGTDRKLENVFDDYPYVRGQRYIIDEIIAQIDPALATDWELPLLGRQILKAA